MPTLSLPLDLGLARKVLAQSLDNISTDYQTQFNTHKAHLKMGNKTEEWLQQGFAAAYEEKCPFCLQKMEDNLEILQAYQQYFNATYKQLIADINTIHSALTAFNLEAILLQIENNLTINWGLIEFWKTYLAKAPTLLPISEEKPLLLAAFKKIKQLFEQKMSNPIEALAISDLTAYEIIFTELVTTQE
ncbi:MAG: hypothetical protein AB8G86_06105 [Saprospiraceae bacterium]